MSSDELLTKKRDLRQESLHLRLQQQSGQLEQPSRLRLLRRDVARMETVLTPATLEDSARRSNLWPKKISKLRTGNRGDRKISSARRARRAPAR